MKPRIRVAPIQVRRQRWHCQEFTEDRYFVASTGELLLSLGPKISEQQRAWILDLIGADVVSKVGVQGRKRREVAT